MFRIVENTYTINGIAIDRDILAMLRPDLPVLPEGVIVARYDGKTCVFSDGKNQSAGPVPWDEADALLTDPDLEADIEASRKAADARPLDEIRAAALENIDQRAESERLRYVTPGSAQTMVYMRKVQEAEAMALDDKPKEVNYPLLSAELGLTADTLKEIAAAVIAKRDLWLGIAASIERKRLTAKRDIAAAADEDDMRAVLDALKF